MNDSNNNTQYERALTSSQIANDGEALIFDAIKRNLRNSRSKRNKFVSSIKIAVSTLLAKLQVLSALS